MERAEGAATERARQGARGHRARRREVTEIFLVNDDGHRLPPLHPGPVQVKRPKGGIRGGVPRMNQNLREIGPAPPDDEEKGDAEPYLAGCHSQVVRTGAVDLPPASMVLEVLGELPDRLGIFRGTPIC